jgi:hypothetical protein
MKRPNIPAMKDLEDTFKEIEDTENRINFLKETVKLIMAEAASQVFEDEKENLAEYLYWTYPELSAGDIGSNVLGITGNKLYLIVKGISDKKNCKECGKPIMIKSRAEMKRFSLKTGYGYNSSWDEVCESCREKILKKNYTEYIIKEEAKKYRLLELKKMPYKEYLTTPEWQETKKAQLKRANCRCQVCNSNEKSLNVHHRTYENRGEETYKDLIVLCQNCHETFHSNGKITD